MGKEGVLNLVDRDNMGKYCSGCLDDSDTNIVQELVNATVGVWGSPAYWNNNVYFGNADDHGHNGPVEAFSLYSTTPLLKLTSHTYESFGYPTPTPSVSSNGTSNGILWALDNSEYASGWPAVLHAYDATNLGSELYTSNQNPCGANDTPGGAVKFSVPTVANGKVYVGGNGELAVFGLSTSKSFCMFVAPPSQTTHGGSEVSYAINVFASGGFTGTVSLSDNCSQWGFTCYLEPSSISGSGYSMMMLAWATIPKLCPSILRRRAGVSPARCKSPLLSLIHKWSKRVWVPDGHTHTHLGTHAA
jgi:hypothetical protein